MLEPREREVVLREREVVPRGFAVRPELVLSPVPELAEEPRPLVDRLDPGLEDFARGEADFPPPLLVLEEARAPVPLDRDDAARDPDALERAPPPLLRDDVADEDDPELLALEPSSAVHLPDITR